MMEPPDQLAPAEGYQRVRCVRGARARLARAAEPRRLVPRRLQIQHLQSGAFGMAYLERDLATGEQVAIKYIPRGTTVRRLRGASAARLPPKPWGRRFARLSARR